jgi:succinoglycan biosynthesis protein ExoO
MNTVPIDVSVIVAAHNIEHYVERAVYSALNQRDVNVEVIVVDDGSDDNTWSLLCGIQDARLKRIRLSQNSGPSIARNAAIAEAAGKWIAILDGDDAYMPDRLAICLRRAREINAEIVVDNPVVQREADGKKFLMFSKSRFLRYDMLTLADFIAGNRFFFGSSYTLGYLKPVFLMDFLRRKNLCYDPDIRIGEDYLLLAEALANGARCAIERSTGYVYTERIGSLSHRLSLDGIKRMMWSNARFTARYPLDPYTAKMQAQREAGLKEIYRFTLLVEAIKQKDLLQALKIALLYPAASRHLWRPLWVRVNRLLPQS